MKLLIAALLLACAASAARVVTLTMDSAPIGNFSTHLDGFIHPAFTATATEWPLCTAHVDVTSHLTLEIFIYTLSLNAQTCLNIPVGRTHIPHRLHTSRLCLTLEKC